MNRQLIVSPPPRRAPNDVVKLSADFKSTADPFLGGAVPAGGGTADLGAPGGIIGRIAKFAVALGTRNQAPSATETREQALAARNQQLELQCKMRTHLEETGVDLGIRNLTTPNSKETRLQQEATLLCDTVLPLFFEEFSRLQEENTGSVSSRVFTDPQFRLTLNPDHAAFPTLSQFSQSGGPSSQSWAGLVRESSAGPIQISYRDVMDATAKRMDQIDKVLAESPDTEWQIAGPVRGK